VSKVSGIHKLYEDIYTTTKVYKYLATADVEISGKSGFLRLN
jgi:hypothetical protein